jgi:hypothetical protein
VRIDLTGRSLIQCRPSGQMMTAESKGKEQLSNLAGVITFGNHALGLAEKTVLFNQNYA